MIITNEVTVDKLVENHEEIYSEKEVDEIKVLNPWVYYELTNDKPQLDRQAFISIARALYLEVIKLDNTAFNILVKKQNSNLVSTKKFERINRLLSFIGMDEVRNNNNDLQTVYDMKVKAFNGVDYCLNNIDDLVMANHSTKGINENTKLVFEHVRSIIHKMSYVHGSYLTREKGLSFKERAKKDIDTNIFFGDLNNSPFLTFEKYAQFFEEIKMVDGYQFAPNLLPYKSAVAISFFDMFKFNQSTDLLNGNSNIIIPSQKDKIDVLAASAAEDLRYQRTYLGISNKEMQSHKLDRRIMARIRSADEMRQRAESAGINLGTVHYTKSDFSKYQTLSYIRKMISVSSLEMSRMLNQVYQMKKS